MISLPVFELLLELSLKQDPKRRKDYNAEVRLAEQYRRLVGFPNWYSSARNSRLSAAKNCRVWHEKTTTIT